MDHTLYIIFELLIKYLVDTVVEQYMKSKIRDYYDLQGIFGTFLKKIYPLTLVNRSVNSMVMNATRLRSISCYWLASFEELDRDRDFLFLHLHQQIMPFFYFRHVKQYSRRYSDRLTFFTKSIRLPHVIVNSITNDVYTGEWDRDLINYYDIDEITCVLWTSREKMVSFMNNAYPT